MLRELGTKLVSQSRDPYPSLRIPVPLSLLRRVMLKFFIEGSYVTAHKIQLD